MTSARGSVIVPCFGVCILFIVKCRPSKARSESLELFGNGLNIAPTAGGRPNLC
jgi:hypothetical protein